MLYNKLKFILIFAVLFVAGLAFVVTPATAVVIPVLSVPDELANDDADEDTQGIQVYGLRAESVSFELTITFQDNSDSNNPVNTLVTGFDAEDIVLQALDSNDDVIPEGATASRFGSTDATGSVYTTTITVKGNVNKVNIASASRDSARTLDDSYPS